MDDSYELKIKDNLEFEVNEAEFLSLVKPQDIQNLIDRATQLKEFIKTILEASDTKEYMIKIPNIMASLQNQSREELSDRLRKIDSLVIKNTEKKKPLPPIGLKKKGLFYNVKIDDSFGVSQSVAYLVYHLPKLLEKAELKRSKDGNWLITSEHKNSSDRAIRLKYEFLADSEQQAKEIYNDYIKQMKGNGTRAWLAYWRIANEIGSTDQCIVPMTEVMKCIPRQKRTSNYFSTAEKLQHWNSTKMLCKTTISTELILEQKKSNKKIMQWVEYPLLRIFAGENEIDGDSLDSKSTYPITIGFKVLDSDMPKKGFQPAIYDNNTLKRPTTRVFLAFYIQTRATQLRNKENPNIDLDWDFLFLISNLEDTAFSNSRLAKSRVVTEMKELKKEGIITDFKKHEGGIVIYPKNQGK